MKYIFSITTKKSTQYKKFVSDSKKLLSARSDNVKLAYSPSSILSYMTIANYNAIFVDWVILSKNFSTFERQLRKINKIVPLILITNDYEIDGELFVPCSSLFRVINQSSAVKNIPEILNDIRQYYKLLEELPPRAKSVITPNGFESMIGNSPVMLSVYKQLAKVSQTNFTTLILGESGCGKELVVNIIHNLSSRKNQQLVSLNCAAIPSNLQESELFGFEKGAFTDANKEKAGKFELANHGTLFFDEIGDMPLDLQSKLLRVLESNTYVRLGGIKDKEVDARYIAATNKNLNSMVKENSFRSDLFYRLNVIPIELPLLKERGNDIVLLCLNIIGKILMQGSLSLKSISWELIEELTKLPLMGNIRELENVLTRVIFNSRGPVLVKETLSEVDIASDHIEKPILDSENVNSEIIPLSQVEKIVINKALNIYHGNISKIAKILEISRSALYRKIKKYNLGKNDLIS
jgi:DNA-binding NtrC family response regulator